MASVHHIGPGFGEDVGSATYDHRHFRKGNATRLVKRIAQFPARFTG